MWRSGYANVWICEGKDQLRYHMGLNVRNPTLSVICRVRRHQTAAVG